MNVYIKYKKVIIVNGYKMLELPLENIVLSR
jgi:hypothetical protein